MKRQGLLCSAIALLQAVAECKDVVVESLPMVPMGWKKLRDTDPSQTIKLRVALEQPNTAQFEQTLTDISTPQHALYGQHLSRDELKTLMKPREESTAAVLEWLRSSGVAQGDIEDRGEWINFKTTVSKAESMLNTDFAVYNHFGTEAELILTLHYSVPSEVMSHITMIQPTTRFGQIRPQALQISEVFSKDEVPSLFKVAAKVPTQDVDVSQCNSTITPECLRALYNIGDTVADPEAGSIFGVSGFLEEYAKHDALDHFLEQFAPYALAQNFTTNLVNGGLDNQTDTVDDDVEANLDMQYAAAIGFQNNIQYYSVGGRGELVPDLVRIIISSQPDPATGSNEPYLEYLNYLLDLADDELPHTLTTSYGEDEQSVPRTYVEKVCQMFGQLGARGTSVIFSSGDTGPGSACQTNDGKNTTRLLPIFPAACPWVTSVGGTVGVRPERAVSFSSGGFSDVFARPAYQDAAVRAYLSEELGGGVFAGLYSRGGRGFPDVSAAGSGFSVASRGGGVARVSGTSASAPAFAGVVSLLNSARAAAGLPPLGFLNPWLYGVAAPAGALTDVVDGGSRGCTGRDVYSGLPAPAVPGAGWNATAGWDPVTGLGTPLFDKMLEKAAPGVTLPKVGAA